MQLPEYLPKRFKEGLEAFIRGLEDNFESDFSVYLFGSLARGDYLLDSDIDIIVVTDKIRDLKTWERTAALRRMAPKNVGFDIICYTQEEFERTKEQWKPFIRIV